MDDGYGGMIYVPNPNYKEQQKLGKRSIFIRIRLLQLQIVLIKLQEPIWSIISQHQTTGPHSAGAI